MVYFFQNVSKLVIRGNTLFQVHTLIKITSPLYSYVAKWEIWSNHITDHMRMTPCHDLCHQITMALTGLWNCYNLTINPKFIKKKETKICEFWRTQIWSLYWVLPIISFTIYIIGILYHLLGCMIKLIALQCHYKKLSNYLAFKYFHFKRTLIKGTKVCNFRKLVRFRIWNTLLLCRSENLCFQIYY